jgi:hypothetical protein
MAYTLGNYGIAAPAPQTTVGNARFESVVKAELSLYAWRVGKVYGGHQAMLAVAHCIANRHKRGWGPWLAIIESIPKHSATLESPSGMPSAWDRDFLRLLSEIDPIVDQTARDTTNGALFFGDLNNITNPWFLENIARSPEHQRVGDCAGTLVFWN